MLTLVGILSFIRSNRWIVFALAGAILLIALCALAYYSGGAGVRHADDQETIQLQTLVIAADGNAADARVADTVRITKQEQELKDVAKSTATSTSDDARRARLCVVMRQQGRNSDADASGCRPAPTR